MDNFTPVPNWAFDHLADGRLTPPMYVIYTFMLHSCTWSSGAWRGTAARIVYALNEEWSVSQVNRYLTRLHNCGYIDRQNVPGARGSYRIMLNNYAHEETILRPTELKDWRELKSPDAQHDASEMRGRCVGDAQRDACEMRSNLDIPDGQDTPNVQTSKQPQLTKEVSKASPDLPDDLSEEERKAHPRYDHQDYLSLLDKHGTNWTGETDELSKIWYRSTHQLWTEYCVLKAKQLIDQHGFDDVRQLLTDTFKCPKLTGYTWTHFYFWAQNYDRTDKTVLAWKRVLDALPKRNQRPQSDSDRYGADFLSD